MSIYYTQIRNTAIADLPDPDFQSVQTASPIPDDERATIPEALPGGAAELNGIRVWYFWANDAAGTRNTDADLGSVDLTPIDIATLDGPDGDESYGAGSTFAGLTRDDILLIPGQRSGDFAFRLSNPAAPPGATHVRVYWEPY